MILWVRNSGKVCLGGLYLIHMVLVGAPGLGDLFLRCFLHSNAWCLHDHVSSILLGPFHEIGASHNMVVSGSCAYTMADFSNSQEVEVARKVGALPEMAEHCFH